VAKQLAFYFDASACGDCKACQIACMDRADRGVEVKWRRVYQYEGGGWLPHPTQPGVMVPSNVFTYSLSISCMHCEEPICQQVCPAAAITKRDDGIVLIDADKCIGCRYCEWACPYGAPQFDDAEKVMTKCDFCADLLDAGGNPACVDACVMRCLDFGELEELRAKYGDVASVAPLADPETTRPAFVMTPHKDSQVKHANGRLVNFPEEV